MISRRFHRFCFLLVSLVLASSVMAVRGPVSGERALEDAERLVAMRPQFSLYRAQGTSMEPFFHEDALLVVSPTSWEGLEEGMIVLFRDGEGDVVAHQIVDLDRDSAKTAGFNNRRADRERITADNLMGTVAGIFHTSGFEATPDLPVALGKTDRS